MSSTETRRIHPLPKVIEASMMTAREEIMMTQNLPASTGQCTTKADVKGVDPQETVTAKDVAAAVKTRMTNEVTEEETIAMTVRIVTKSINTGTSTEEEEAVIHQEIAASGMGARVMKIRKIKGSRRFLRRRWRRPRSKLRKLREMTALCM